MKNIIIIPILAECEEDLLVPLGRLGETTLLQATYNQAKSTQADNVVVTSNSLTIAQFCSVHKISFFPSSKECPTGTHRCAEIASKFRPEANIGNVICWPVCYPSLSAFDINKMMDLYNGEGVITLVSDAIQVSKDTLEEFYADTSLVKVRAFGNAAQDFSRCPLPMSLYHVGIYMYSLSQLLQIGQIAPTRLSIEEDLEQLSWLQYGTKIFVSDARRTGNHTFPVTIRTTNQLAQANASLLQEQL